MVPKVMVELNGIVILLSDFGFGSPIRLPDGSWWISRNKREDGNLSSLEEQKNEDIQLGMKPLQSQEDTETNTERGAEARFDLIRCQQCKGTGVVTRFGVGPGNMAECPSCKGDGEFRLEKKNDLVNYPNHYMSKASCPGCGRMIECIDVVQHFNFNKGNTIKYVWRAGSKSDEIQDLEKAGVYIAFEIDRLKSEAT